jgi:hypothetical protein
MNNTLFLCRAANRRRACFLGICCFALALTLAAPLAAQEKAPPALAGLWALSWELEGPLINRGDLHIALPWRDLTFRVQVLDKRPTGEAADFRSGSTAFSGGLYLADSARLLYGKLDEQGLGARVSDTWRRAVPFVEKHEPASSDLKTEPSASAEPKWYLYLGGPTLGRPFRPFAALTVDGEKQAAINAGTDIQFTDTASLRLEGYYTGKTLPPRESSTWFSEKPALPERDFRLFAAGAVFTGPAFSAAADWAYSETFAFGRDSYANLGVTVGTRPWRLSLAMDGAGPRFVGSNGGATGAGFRTAARAEWRGSRSALFRASATLRALEFGTPFDRGSAGFYYYFPSVKNGLPVHLTRVSLDLKRDATDLKAVTDRAEALAAFSIGPVRPAFQAAISGVAVADAVSFPLPLPAGQEFSSASLSGALAYSRTKFRLSRADTSLSFSVTGELGYTVKARKEAVWAASVSASCTVYQAAWTQRFGLKLEAGDLGNRDKWTGTLSWRFEF